MVPPPLNAPAEIAAEYTPKSAPAEIISPTKAIPPPRADMSQFPVLGSKEAESASRASPQVNKGARHHRPSFHDSDLPEEERMRLARRSNKVSRITRFSGFMNPRDKDFVTRFQLSQIVTEDPYNEDFYYQVHKVLNVQGDNLGGMSSIAEKYLEHSGHRLGGRNKRADVALQRMQQQVSKAVSVAKERGAKNATLAKEGALGKVSIGSGKTPKRQLNIKVKDDKEATPEVQEGSLVSGLKEKSFAQPPALDKKVSKSSKLFFLLLIEQIYEIVLKLESSERENQLTEESVGELWSLLGFSDSPDDTHGQDFVNTLSYDKGMKIFPRLFHFLSYEQKLIIITVIMKNMQKIDIILKSSHRNNFGSDTGMPTTVLRKMEVFQITVLKTLVFFLSDAKFVEVLNLLIIIINENNLLFLCTTKLGLSIITILISRLEVIKQENQTMLGAQDLSAWAATYDKLFQSLEGRFKSIFHQPLEDDSYIWQFFASLSLAGKLNHQRVIVDEIRDEIFGVMGKAKLSAEQGDQELSSKLIGDLNLFLNVMGLNATETDITELKG